MSVAKPTGDHAEEMLDPGGWVDTDEQSLYDRAHEFTQTLQQLTKSLEGLQQEQTEIFNGGLWEGGGASAANARLGQVVDQLTALQNDLVKAITWFQKVAGTVEQTKTTIAERVTQAQRDIGKIESDSESDAKAQANAINALVKKVHGENTTDVTAAAGKVPSGATWKAPPGALKALLDQKAPPPVNGRGPAPTGASTAMTPGGQGGQAGPGGAPLVLAGQPGGPGPGLGGQGGQAGPGGAPLVLAGQPGGPAPFVQVGLQPQAGPRAPFSNLGINPPSFGGPGSGPCSPMMNGFGGISGGQPPSMEAAAFGGRLPDTGLAQAGSGQGLGQSPPNTPLANAVQAAQAAAANSAMVAPAAAQGPPASAQAATTAGTGGSAAAVSGGHGGSVGGMSAPATVSDAGASAASSMPLLPPATPHPAAPVSATGGSTPGTPATGSGGPGVHPASTTSIGRGGVGGSMMSSQAEAAPAPIPVSSARAQKDVIAQATRRQTGGDVQLAYRVAAALNAADMGNKTDFRFFWMTAITADGQIVVANSYGLGYIPDGVNLPTQVTMASADDTIPVEERARWTTYPNLALQGWAAHHDATLKMMIARQEHFAGIDPGVPTQFVADEDIPTSGKMQGRSRLDVVAPADAARLASTSDLALVELLPPAPVDATPPADQRSSLWWELMKHLMSSDADRGAAHLQAFSTYAAHAQELALHQAYTAVHAVEQRAAVADWLYWQHIVGLLNEALASTAR